MDFTRKKKELIEENTPGIVQVTDKYRLVMDKYNVSIESLHDVKNKDTEEVEKVWKSENKHYSSIANALYIIAELDLRESSSLDDMARRINLLKSTILLKLKGKNGIQKKES